MTNNKQQTAVEWYIIKRDEIEMKIRSMLICANEYEQELIKADEQAKEMEKEQIAKAFDDGDYNYHYSRKTGDDFEDGKEYFNEVYG
jgi:hypothetical protein